jgi:hypothetical protein
MLPEKLRALAEQLEARGDWDEAKIVREAADALIKHVATIKAYQHSIEKGVIINFKTGELLP